MRQFELHRDRFNVWPRGGSKGFALIAADCSSRGPHDKDARSTKYPVWAVLTTDTGVAFSEQNSSTISTACKGENGDLQKASLRWIEVNSVTHKLTDGVTERTPASHGQWGGFNIERGVAWVIEVGWPFKKVAWYARCGDSSYGPTDFNTAKHAAMAFAKGAKSFPQSGIASSFTGPINLHADPEVAAEMRNSEWRDWPPEDDAP